MNYKSNLIELLSKVNKIQPQLIINKLGEDQIEIKANDKEVSVCYHLKAPQDYFEFPGEKLAFYDYNHFYTCFNVYNKPNKDEKLSITPVLDVKLNDKQEVSDLLIKSSNGKSKISLRCARPDVLVKPVFQNEIKIPSIDAKFSFTEEEFNGLLDMINIIDANAIKFKYEADNVIITLYNTKSSNTYDITYKLEFGVEIPFELTIPTTGIKQIPKGYSYNVETCSRGLWVFNQVREDDINMKLYISKR